MNSKKCAIVCVDDEKIILNSLKNELLSYFGNKYSYEIAQSGEEALELIEELIEEGYDIPIVISDCIMKGGMYGNELLHEVRKKHHDTICVLLTGQTHNNFEKEHNSIDKMLHKPWSSQELMEIVTEATLTH